MGTVIFKTIEDQEATGEKGSVECGCGDMLICCDIM